MPKKKLSPTGRKSKAVGFRLPIEDIERLDEELSRCPPAMSRSDLLRTIVQRYLDSPIKRKFWRKKR